MGPPKNAARTISQEAFDEVVKENMEDLGMDPTEALEDAIQTLTLQGVDLSGIVTCVPGEGSVKDNPVLQCLDRLSQLNSSPNSQIGDEVVDLLDKLTELCKAEGSGNAAIASRNGGVEIVCSICSKIEIGCERAVFLGLRALASLLHDLQSREAFRASGGPKILVGILTDGFENIDIVSSGFSVVAAAATSNEVIKELFMELKIDELILRVLSVKREVSIESLYDAIRVLLTPDDNRVLASQVYGYARNFAKIGIAGALVESDEICTSIAENGGIDAVLLCIDDSSEQGNKTVAKVCCSLLCKLAGSDTNKNAIVEKKGMDRLMKLSSRFFDDPSILQEIMAVISVLSLRSPDNAAIAIEAGAGELALQAMQKFPAAQQMQRNSCLMIRNLVSRNAANRTILLNSGIEKHIRMAKQNHVSCKEAATDALRDLGLDDYNM
ncbi:armadillo repeat-containing protein 6 [Pyrus ussuriensis x Pyrus communis]|uniref:Armadillo repeat-containing protein 6 n=1 Tax=Pyrus ussuriensis x Pyrus communis TaxID=2448454 RepID=A0A5N5I7A7_9ROSA|nr:armadillo repeat-containing protein 6 [Pyrus ussuriensis x Pyrus communis]